jgi:two-component system, NarL family, sensor histidine kinase DesK
MRKMFQIRGKEIQIFPNRYGFFPYVFLIYVLFPIYFLTNEDGLKQVLGYCLLVVFLVSYRQLYFANTNRKFSVWLTVQLTIVFIFCVFYNLNYVFLGFFPANFIGWYTDKKLFKYGLIGLLFVELFPIAFFILRNQYRFSVQELLYFVPFLIIMFISPFGIRSMNKRMDLEKKLDEANQQIKELVKREERVRIARDLHDTLGHTLSLLTLKSQLVQRLTAVDPERARLEAKEMEITSRAALKQVRELVTDMRAITLVEELIEIQQILKAADIAYHFKGPTQFSDILTPFIQNILSMCIREAATNVVKHSRAKNCYLSINLATDHICLEIKDDGMGVHENHLFGNGLNGMKERLDLIEGNLTIVNQHGTVVKLIVPIIEKVKQEGTAI